MTLQLIPLCRATLELGVPVDLGATPSGRRLIIEIERARFEGERLNASLVGHTAADWLTTSTAPAVASPDVRMSLRTDDGALIYLHYRGRADFSAGPTAANYYGAPVFEVADERYAWLASIQAVAKGSVSDDMRTLSHEIYELSVIQTTANSLSRLAPGLADPPRPYP